MEIEPVMKQSYIKLSLGSKRVLLTACHTIPSRSFFYKGKPLLCFRCLGINIGFFLPLIIQMIFLLLSILDYNTLYFVINDPSYKFTTRFLITMLLIIPLAIDGTLQLMIDRYESINKLRLFTGILGGVGQFYFVFNLGSLTKYYLA